jgi:putative serine protease PepD
MTMGRMNRIVPIALIAILCGSAAGGIVGAIVSNDDTQSSDAAALVQTTAGGAPTPAATYRRDAPGVVQITADETQQVPTTPFTPPARRKVQSLGSGFVIDTRGDIVTNDHVVAGGSGIRVGFTGGSSYPASVVGTDASSDLAVLHVDAPTSKLHPVAFDDSSLVQVGEPVYAIGNPFGLDRTMTAGIVSATGRDIQAPDGLTIPNAIQTDAAINHGNSGGPLLDGSGHVIGVTSQIQGGTVDANVGVGFAIPSNTARSVAEQLIAHHSVQHAWLGVQLRTTPQHGVVVARTVAGSPAAKAGIGGDAIVALDGSRISTPTQLADAVARRRPGDVVRLDTVRGGAHRVVSVTLGNAPQRT